MLFSPEDYLAIFIYGNTFLLNNPLLKDKKGSLLNCAGISEEIFFRGIFISYLKKIFKEKLKGDFYIIFISSILFTLLHFLNLSYTHIIIANLLQQVFAAFCFGIFLGSIYLINRHLRICILIHFLWDLFVSLLKPIVFNKMMRITIILLFLLFEVFIAIFGYLKLCNNMKRE